MTFGPQERDTQWRFVYTQKASQGHRSERRQHSIKALRLVLKEAGVRGALRPREKRDCSISLSRGLE